MQRELDTVWWWEEYWFGDQNTWVLVSEPQFPFLHNEVVQLGDH